MAYNEPHLAPFVLFAHNIEHEFALLTRIDYICILLPNAEASYDNHGDMASFDGHNDTTSFVGLENMASSGGPNGMASCVDLENMALPYDPNGMASFDDHNDAALLAYMAMAVSIVVGSYNSLFLVVSYNCTA